MSFIRKLTGGLRTLLGRDRFERDLDEGVSHFVHMETESRVRAGVPRDDARRQALASLGGVENVKESARSGGWEFTFDSLLRDVSYGLRALRRNPGFTAAAILTLAIGVGGNTTVFSIVNAILLRPPAHVRAPEELVSIYTSDHSGPLYGSSSLADVEDFRSQRQLLSGVATYAPRPVGIGEGDDLQRGGMELVSADYFRVLGIEPVAGRFLVADEGRPGVPAAVAVLSYHLWQQRYGGQPSAVGENVRLSGRTFTIIGVAPQGYAGAMRGLDVAVWVPVTASPLFGGRSDEHTSRGNRSQLVLARLAPGVSLQQARAGMASLATNLARAWPEAWTDVSEQGRRITVLPESDTRVHPQMRGPVLGFAALLMGTVFLVLLVCCANVAGLMLARATQRSHEMGVRLALGATRGRLTRQLLTESALVAVGGAVAGTLLAMGVTRLLLAYEPPLPVQLSLDLRLDLPVLAFTLVASVLTGLVFGIAPALRAGRTQLTGMLKGDSRSRTVGGRRFSLQGLLVSAQVAVSLLLLVGALLFLRSLQAAGRIDPGFSTEGVLVFNTAPRPDVIDRPYDLAMPLRIAERVDALPGVTSVSWASSAPLGFDASRRSIAVDGYEPARGEEMEFHYNIVGPAWLETLSVDLVEGRDLTSADRDGAPPVVVVNEAFARRFWPGQSALGKRIMTRRDIGWAEVVGVARDARYVSLTEESPPYMYFPSLQERDGVEMHVRTSGDPMSLRDAAIRAVSEAAPEWRVGDIRTMEQQVGLSLAPQRVGGTVLSVFGVVALLLVAVGLYGVVAYAVAARTREIGVRMALGARRGDVVWLMVRQGLRLALFGALVGLPLGWAGTRLLSSFVIGRDAGNALTPAAAVVLLGVVASLAAWLPARRAARILPMAALREE
ncbi:MAG: ADOP family duplicated permease [Gemmatimonadota bacterium]